MSNLRVLLGVSKTRIALSKTRFSATGAKNKTL
jgi:hypothetical protein